MPKVHTPLCSLLNEIKAAAESDFPLIAVSMAFALPDICASLANPSGRSEKSDYKKWCDDNLGSRFKGFVTSDDLWSMRCGILHNGRFGDLKHNVARVIFALPGGATFVNCKVNDAYFYSVVEFCRDITSAAHDWMERNASDPTVQANLPRLMQYRTEIAGMIYGKKVIA